MKTFAKQYFILIGAIFKGFYNLVRKRKSQEIRNNEARSTLVTGSKH